MDIILRKYNYKLKTGTVGTDDENIANILLSINKIEMYVPLSTVNLDEIDTAFGKVFFLTLTSKVYLLRFQKIFNDKINNELFNEVVEMFDIALDENKENRETLNREKPDTENLCKVLSTIHKNILDIVPKIIMLDNQAIGRV